MLSEDPGNRNKWYHTHKFSVDSLNDGLYFLELITWESVYKEKMVIKK